MPTIRNLALGLPVRDSHVLVSECFDRVKGLHFFRALGGGVEFGETVEAALRREFFEELGRALDRVELLGVLENIFEYEGAPGHEIVHIFAVDSAELREIPLDAQLHVLDEGSTVRWVPIRELRDGDRPLFPEGAMRYIDSGG